MVADVPRILDPLEFAKLCWPDISFYKEQREIIYSVRDNDETFVPAGNGLGKDFVSAFIALWFFCSRRPARVVTTSVKFDQLNDVLWGEIRRFLDTSVVKLPIIYNHMHIRQVREDGRVVPLCELVGQCTAKGEGLLGRHLPKDIPRTLAIFDEASGIADTTWQSVDTWAHKKLVIGNPFPCKNFFYNGVKGGNIPHPNGKRMVRKVIKIRGDDSPNVRLARAELEAGQEPSGKILVPGVIDFETYQVRRRFWDKVLQTISIDAEFYEGAEVLLFPPDWLTNSEETALKLNRFRTPKTLGVDSAQGGDNTAFAFSDHLGLLRLESYKTPNTAVIIGRTIEFIHQYNLDPHNVLFDAGGGGKQHADILREKGYNVQTVAFGESASPPRKRAPTSIKQADLNDEKVYAYRNRRAEMYGILSLRLDPSTNPMPFALPAEIMSRPRLDGGPSLRSQLAVFPRRYDGEGRLYLPPKSKPDPNSNTECLKDLIGCSPDEADAVILSVFGLEQRIKKIKIGAY